MNRLALVIVALSLMLAFTLGMLFNGRDQYPGPEYRKQARLSTEAAGILDGSELPGQRFTRIAHRLRPSVVSIYGRDASGGSSSGTGMILSRTGDILTNLHVIAGMRSLVVTLSSHERYGAEILGIDPPTDLAVLRIRGVNGLVPMVFGDSEVVEVGAEVLAIGNALGFGWSVTGGIVSSLHRSSVELQNDRRGSRYRDFIQTDAALGRGNSGGPLVNMRGEVIGVNALIVSDDRPGGRIGLAIPSADAVFVARQLIERRVVERGFLGILADNVRNMPRADRQRLGILSMHGVSITTVEAGTPARKAGFQLGDVILEMDGEEIPDYHSLRSRIARTPANTEVDFLVLRDGETQTTRAILTKKPTS